MKKARKNATIIQIVKKGDEQLKGILAVNAFLKGEKYDMLHSHLLKAAHDCDIELEIKTNLDLACEVPKCDFVLFWDKDSLTARLLEKQGVPVFNSAESIELCDNKAKTYLALLGSVPQPKTLIAPLSFFKADYSAFVDKSIEILGLPLVFKECFGSFGEQVFLCRSRQEILEHITEKPFILQEFVSSCKGRDIRIEVIGGKAVVAMKRVNQNDFRANVTNGASAEKYVPSESEKALAQKACRVLGLTFGGVDIFENGVVCEVNSNAHIINLMNCTGIDTAPMIFEEIKRRIADKK